MLGLAMPCFLIINNIDICTFMYVHFNRDKHSM